MSLEVGELRTWRPVIMGRQGAVASNHPLATQAGLDVLRAGGNAADAAVAVGTTLAVVEPHMSGVGGDGFFLVWDAAAREATVIHAAGHAPRQATLEEYSAGIPHTGLRSASVPGLAGGWEALRARFGTRRAPELFAAAIYHAHAGFPATRRFCHFVARQAAALARDPACAIAFLPGGTLPSLGTTIRQPALARTLEALADGGAGVLYGGEIGRELAAFVTRGNGLITAEDLAACRTREAPPLTTSYRGLTVLNAGPPSMGWALLLELNIVEQFDLAARGFLSADTIHLLVEAKKLAFLERERYSGDPRYVTAPFSTLLSREHARALAARIHMGRAMPVVAPASVGGDTTYFAVVDGAGNAVSAIQSLGGFFGACAMDPATGILLNNRMTWWHLDPAHPNALAPGKVVRHTMNTPMALFDGQVRWVFGTPGGDSQVQVNLQVFTAMVDFGLDPQQAVEAPRWDSFQPGTGSVYPHQDADELTMEDRFPHAVFDDLRARGHQVSVLGPLDGPCSAAVIARDPTGLLLCGSDPRRDGWAAAF